MAFTWTSAITSIACYCWKESRLKFHFPSSCLNHFLASTKLSKAPHLIFSRSPKNLHIYRQTNTSKTTGWDHDKLFEWNRERKLEDFVDWSPHRVNAEEIKPNTTAADCAVIFYCFSNWKLFLWCFGNFKLKLNFSWLLFQSHMVLFCHKIIFKIFKN